jgi:hypothetical protein
VRAREREEARAEVAARDAGADLRQSLKPAERADDLGVELRAGAVRQRADCLLVVERVAERARAGHRVVGVGDVDDARGERYLLAREPFGVARPVVVLVVVTHGRGDLFHLRHGGEQTRAALRVEPDDGALLFGERGGLEKDGVGRAYLANVVEQRGQAELFELVDAQTHAPADGRRVAADAPRVAVDVAVFRLQRVGDGAHDAARHRAEPARETLVRLLRLVARPRHLVVLQGARDCQPQCLRRPRASSRSGRPARG